MSGPMMWGDAFFALGVTLVIVYICWAVYQL